jgi:hypothetical protein
MKRHLSIAFLSAALPALLMASPSAIYVNPGVVTAPTNIDAIIFFNLGQFDISGVRTATNLALGSTLLVSTALPFATRDTAYYTNEGSMVGTPGFTFDTSTATTRFSAESFYNFGSIIGIDFPAFPDIYPNPDGSAASLIPPYSQPLPSIVNVNATNIVNQGSISVGDAGLAQLTGQNVNLANGSVIAGFVSDSAPNNTTGNVDDYEETATTMTSYFVDPPGVYDLFAAVTNAVNEYAGDLVFPASELGRGNGWIVEPPFPLEPLNNRTLDLLLLEEVTNMTAYAYVTTDFTGTNIYYDVVFVNTNFANPNITASVRFGRVPSASLLSIGKEDPNGLGEIVRFSESVMDLSSGSMVSNSIYLLDTGLGYTNNYSLAINAAYANGYGRPDRLEVSTSLPVEWEEGNPANVPFDQGLLYTAGEFSTEPVPMNFGDYGVQVGRDPERLDGLDPLTAESLLLGTDDIPDPTNEPGRVEIRSRTLNLANTRLQAEGVVTLNATNVLGVPAGTDWGNVNSALGSRTNELLVISNLFPTTFHRLRGDISAWCGNWVNTQTNDNFGNTNAVFNVTNLYHYHVLVVNQDLRGVFTSTERNLSLRATNVVVQDALRVIDNVLIAATNLTLNNNNIFTQNAGSLTATNLPGLQNLLINPTASVTVDNEFDVGYDLNTGTTSPSGRKYAVASVTNLGAIAASVALFDCASFENDGSIATSQGGAIIIEANALGMGLAVPNSPNSLQADGGITLSANSIRVNNSIINAGNDGYGQLVLNTAASGLLTDTISGAPSTNQQLVNLWQVTGGFSLLQKPAAGDLFGTEITTISTGFNVANHVWAGTDDGNSPAGFSNNVVIGHLKLSRQSANSELIFSGAGAKNGMYVDYLELDTTSLSYTDYRDGLVIDPNLTIYFADSNVDPFKLEDAYPNRLVWVPAFAGPNSTQAVPYENSTNVCLMNAALATSQDLSFFPGTPPNFYNQPYVLNNPTNPANTYPCPGVETTDKSLLLLARAAGSATASLAMISWNGDGRISPLPKQLTPGQSYTLTATPASGWLFGGWQTSGLAGNEKILGNVLKFSPGANTTIVANFVPNLFIPVQGVYNGLFYNPSAVNPGSSGFFSLALRPSGAYSGHLLMGPETYTFSSNFLSTGVSQVEAKLPGKPPLTLNLQLATTNGANRISGNVSQAGWDAPSQLWADLGLTWTGTNHSPWAGSYTASLPWNTSTPSAGDSYVTATVSDSGLLSAIGGLADGATFSQTVPISKEGLWPFYAYVSSAKDLVLGWVTVGTNGLASTNVTWSKGANNGPYYKEGFTNVFQLLGSPYQAQDLPLGLTNLVVVLSGADWPQNLSNSVTLQNNLSYTSSIVSLHIQAAAGSFNGWWVNTSTGKREAISGVVLQNTDTARGFFLGASTNESGGVLLQSQ